MDYSEWTVKEWTCFVACYVDCMYGWELYEGQVGTCRVGQVEAPVPSISFEEVGGTNQTVSHKPQKPYIFLINLSWGMNIGHVIFENINALLRSGTLQNDSIYKSENLWNERLFEKHYAMRLFIYIMR